MKPVLAVLLCLLLFSRALTAREVVRLEGLEARALTRRAAIEVERARLHGARSGVDLARSARLPRFGVSLYARGGPGGQLVRVTDVNGNEYLTQGTPPIDGVESFEPRLGYGAAFAADQLVHDFGRTSAAVEAAEAEGAGAEAGLTAARQRVLREVRMAYLDWVSAILAQRGAQGSLLRARERRLRVAGHVAEGLRSPDDAEAAVRQELLIEIEALKQDNRVEAARLALARASATPLPRDAEPDLRVLERVPARASAQNAELVALRKRADAAVKNARARERSGRPVITAQANLGVRGQNELLAPYYDVTLALSAPLWDGGARSSQARTEQARAAATLAESRELEDALRIERELALADFQAARQRVTLSERLHALAVERLRGAAERYDAGSATFEVVLEAEDELARAEQELYGARLARAEAAFRLEN